MPKVFRVFAALMLAAFLCVPNAGCTKDEVALNAYKTLETSAETYKAVMDAAQDLHRMGKMTDEQWDQVKDYAVVYFDSYQTAVAALVKYVEVTQGVKSPGAEDGEPKPSAAEQEQKLGDMLSGCTTTLNDLLVKVQGQDVDVAKAKRDYAEEYGNAY